MNTITLSKFNDILNHESDYLGGDYLFYNIDRCSLLKIRESIKARKVLDITDIIVLIDNSELKKLEYIVSTAEKNKSSIEYFVLSTYLSTLICKELFNYMLMHNEFTDELLTPSNVIANQNLKNCQNIKEYSAAFNRCDTFDFDSVQTFIHEHRKEKFVFHFFIPKEMNNVVLQKEINRYIGQYNGIFHSRIYTENEHLINYYNTAGHPIQPEHDFCDFDGIEKEPVLKSNQKKLPK